MSKYRIVQKDVGGIYRVMYKPWYSPVWLGMYWDSREENCILAIDNHQRFGVFAYKLVDL